MWQRLTERARRVVFFAQEEAARWGHHEVGSEHVLLGLLREGDCVAARVLEDRLHISTRRIRSEVEQHAQRGAGGNAQDMQLADSAKQVIDMAYAEAKILQTNYIGTEHILLGLARVPDSLGGRILADSGATLERLRPEVQQLLKDSTSVEPNDANELSSLKENLHKVAESLKNRAQGKRDNETTPPEINVLSSSIQRGDIGVLKNTDDRAVVEFVPSESDLAAFEDVMRIKDEYAYRELVTSGKVLLLDAGTQAKLLKRGNGTTDYIRILSGKLAGEVGYALRSNLRDFKPDDRPFPPPVED